MRPTRLATVLLAALALSTLTPAARAAAPAAIAEVFRGPPAACEPPLGDGAAAKGGPLRVLTVDERVGEARVGELVRVPLFFHEGECADPAALAVFAAEDAARKTPLPVQVDDVRRDSAGRVSRLHLYFAADLPAWGRRQFHLVAGRAAPAPSVAPVTVTETADRVTLAGDDIQIALARTGPRAGALVALTTPLGRVEVGPGGLVPQITLVRQGADTKPIRTTPLAWAEGQSPEVRRMTWGTGPLFAKLVVVLGPKGVSDNVEFTWRVPRTGAQVVLTQRLFPTEADTPEVVGAKENVLLTGPLLVGGEAADQRVVTLPAGLRQLTRLVHGHTTPALVNAKAGLSLLPVPYVQATPGQMECDAGGRVTLGGARTFQRTTGGNSATLRAFWGEVRLRLTRATDEEALWHEMRAAFQPLVAVADEPGVTVEDFHAAMAEVKKSFDQIKYWGKGWAQDAGLAYLAGNAAAMTKSLGKAGQKGEDRVESWLPKPPPPPKPGEKAKAPGKTRLDPYDITFGLSGFVPMAAWAAPSEKLDAVALAVARGQRQLNGKTDAFGLPYVNCFATALNMQLGSALCGLWAAPRAADADLALFYRDAVTTPALLGIYGHGQRPYTGCVKGADPSDLLYEALSDLWLRTTELVAQEDLVLHPAIYGRYFDCIDVMADQCHRRPGEPGEAAPSWHRGNFFRTQSHDHRWEAWDAAPYVGLLARAPDAGRVGLTDAVAFLRHRAGRKFNWSELMPLVLASLDVRHGLAAYRPQPRPALPGQVRASPAPGGGVTVTWQAAPGKPAGYRVYRADRMGGPWTLLNSPYAEKPAALVAATTFADPAGRADQAYFVTTMSAEGRESRWFADEPLPQAGAR
jgi:hypothetical protein